MCGLIRRNRGCHPNSIPTQPVSILRLKYTLSASTRTGPDRGRPPPSLGTSIPLTAVNCGLSLVARVIYKDSTRQPRSQVTCNSVHHPPAIGLADDLPAPEQNYRAAGPVRSPSRRAQRRPMTRKIAESTPASDTFRRPVGERLHPSGSTPRPRHAANVGKADTPLARIHTHPARPATVI